MKKSERILELMMELEKELASLPEEVQGLSKKISEYDIVNSEMYHTILNFNPSASESAKFIKNWKEVLHERNEVKTEWKHLDTFLRRSQSLKSELKNLSLYLKERLNRKENPFTYKTEIGQRVINESFSNFEERTTYPSHFEKKKSAEALDKTSGHPYDSISLAKEWKVETIVPKASDNLILDSNEGKFYLIHKKGIVFSASTWNELVEYLNEKVHFSIQVEKETKHKLNARLSHTLKASPLTPHAKKAIQNMIKNNSPKRSTERVKRMALYEELTAVKLGKYQLPGQSDQQKKSSL